MNLMRRHGLMLVLVTATGLFCLPHRATAQQRDALTPADPANVTMRGFLGGRMDANREGRLKQHVTEEVLLAGFRQRPGTHPWTGEHVGKWLHAAILAYRQHPDDALKGKIDTIAKGLMSTQTADGYLGTYNDAMRWSGYDRDKKTNERGGWDVWVHKYVLIGLLDYYQLTEDAKALDACKRIGDLLIATFGDGKKDIIDAGTHAGMASISVLEPMCILYRDTKEPRYLDFCRYLVQRGEGGPHLLSGIETFHTVQAVGNKKAYEMMSCYVGLIEYWRITGDQRCLRAAEEAWESIDAENMFITGAPDAHEHFSEPYTLESTGHCTETCVQVTWVQLCWQLLRATGKPRYAVALHQICYNHLPAAQHADGVNWCYFTTMEGSKEFGDGIHCCGSSGPRAIAMIPTFAYMTGADTLAINLYETSTFTGRIGDTPVTVAQRTGYPWTGDIEITVKPEKTVRFALRLLLPPFVRGGEIQMDGKPAKPLQVAGRYAILDREWSSPTTVTLHWPMPLVATLRDGDRVAISKGPIVLAAEMPAKQEPRKVSLELSSLVKVRDTAWSTGDDGRHLLSLPAHINQDTKETDLTFRPYAEAGEHKEVVSVWLPVTP